MNRHNILYLFNNIFCLFKCICLNKISHSSIVLHSWFTIYFVDLLFLTFFDINILKLFFKLKKSYKQTLKKFQNFREQSGLQCGPIHQVNVIKCSYPHGQTEFSLVFFGRLNLGYITESFLFPPYLRLVRCAGCNICATPCTQL